MGDQASELDSELGDAGSLADLAEAWQMAGKGRRGAKKPKRAAATSPMVEQTPPRAVSGLSGERRKEEAQQLRRWETGATLIKRGQAKDQRRRPFAGRPASLRRPRPVWRQSWTQVG